jgi:hypothetical protein
MSTLEELAMLWTGARTGPRCTCSKCGEANLALLVTEQCVYRWTCVDCGWRTDWFVVENGAIRMSGRKVSMELSLAMAGSL